jgi:hypothetical protein
VVLVAMTTLAERGDAEGQQSIDAVLGSPPFLAGLTSQQHADVRVLAAERWCRQDHRQLNACKIMLRAIRVSVEHMGTVPDRLKTHAEASPGTVAGKKRVELSQL